MCQLFTADGYSIRFRVVLNVKVDYLIIPHAYAIKGGWPGQNHTCHGIQRSWEHFRVSLKLLLLQNTHLDHLYLRATSPYRHVYQCNVCTQGAPFLYPPSRLNFTNNCIIYTHIHVHYFIRYIHVHACICMYMYMCIPSTDSNPFWQLHAIAMP